MTFRLLPLLAILALGCGRVDVDTLGLACPCGDDNECDRVCNVCVPPGTAAGASCTSCKISFSDFHADWVTPNSIGWTWGVPNKDAYDVFGSYTLTLTASGKPPRLYDSTTNPELGLLTLPNSGQDPVDFTIANGLEPNVIYTGELVARDKFDCEFAATSIARATIQPASNVAIELFGEGSTTGSIDAQYGAVVDTDCHVGTKCLLSPTPACELLEAESTCTSLLKFAHVDISVDENNLSKGEFPDAYLEVYAKISASAPSWYSTVWLRTISPDQIWRYDGFTLPNDNVYRPVQVPLHELTLEGSTQKLTRDALVVGGIYEFNVAALIPPSGAVMADEVFIRR